MKTVNKNGYTFFLCNRKKCPKCSNECCHTKDIKFALNPEGAYNKDNFGNMWQKTIKPSSKIISLK